MRGPHALVAAAGGALVLALMGITLPASASAMPWDQEGIVTPSRTPPPQRPDPGCEQSYANDPPQPGPPIEFGIGPRLAGEAGASQASPVVPVNRRKRDRALLALRGNRRVTVRLNRLFESDGAAGLAEFKRMAHHYGALGFDVLVQVRYHPTHARVAEVPPGTMWWRAEFIATRAEALVRAEDAGAPAAIADAEATIGDHRYAGGVLLRGRAIETGSEEMLREALAVFAEIGCPYQAARTGWLLGGSDRVDAERTLAKLGATMLPK